MANITDQDEVIERLSDQGKELLVVERLYDKGKRTSLDSGRPNGGRFSTLHYDYFRTRRHLAQLPLHLG
ncbi:MAG: hypothetical protein JO308_08620 [Verrucomicrobia bacterium]|nr:hypothetical protein [Verrucomicrobiota bacterium]